MKTLITLVIMASMLNAYTAEDKIRYTASKKIEWVKSHPHAYKASVESRIAKIRRDAQKEIDRVHKKSEAREKASKQLEEEKIETFALKAKLKKLEKEIEKADRKFVARTSKTNLEGIKAFYKSCNIKGIKIVEEGTELICYLSKSAYIKELERKINADQNSTGGGE